MIRRQGEYYICEDDQPAQPPPPQHNHSDKQLTSVGDIRERLTLIKERVQALKEQRKAAPLSSKISLSAAFQQTAQQLADYSVNLSIPGELLALQSRVQRLEQKISGNEVQRQGVERGGTIVERVKRLQRKLQEMIKNKSVEIINQNINQYSSNLDEKEENFKHLYLYDVFNRTQGLTTQIEILEKYLTSLSKVQRTVNSLPPVSTLLNTHNNLLSKKEELQARIDKMFKFMKEQYQKLLSQIDAIDL